MRLSLHSRIGLLTLTTLLISATPRPAAAEWHFVPFLGQTFKGTTTLVDWEDAADDRHWNVGAAVTLIGDGPVGVEAYYVRTPGFFQSERGAVVGPDPTSSRTYAFMGNLVLAIPRDWNRYGLRPYVSAGLGLLHASYEERVVPAQVDLLGMNVGGGGVGFVTDRVGLRFDLRYFSNVRGVREEDRELAPTLGQPVRVRYWTGGVGLVVRY